MFIIHLGFSGFPKGMASVQRTLLTFKGLKEAGGLPLIINKISHHENEASKTFQRFEGIPYINTSLSGSKPSSFVKRNLNKLSGYFGELRFLFKKRKNIGTAILYSTYFAEYPYYFILSRLLGFKLVIQYVEMFSAIPGRQSFFTKINDRLIDKYIGSYCDGTIAISDYLANHVKKIAPGKPVIKIPANSDFYKMDAVAAAQSSGYLMYCGTIYYEEVIEFIMTLFVRLKKNNQYSGQLLLIISGDHEQNWNKLTAFKKSIEYQTDILIKSNIPYAELLSDYKGADLLMIPLRDTIQDIARFPHKIGEYSAAKKPILSTNLGELKAYFKDGISAILADDYSIEAYHLKLSSILSSEAKMQAIGLEGYKIGLDNFDYRQQGKQLFTFINNLGNKAVNE